MELSTDCEVLSLADDFQREVADPFRTTGELKEADELPVLADVSPSVESLSFRLVGFCLYCVSGEELVVEQPPSWQPLARLDCGAKPFQQRSFYGNALNCWLTCLSYLKNVTTKVLAER